MGIYRRYILPRFIDAACGVGPIARQREKITPHASGRVLEIGIGSGLNLPFYDATKIEKVIGLDPSEEMLTIARGRAENAPFEVEFLKLEGENIPLDAASVDSVLITYSLCTIPDTLTALEGMRRVLKPGGRLFFCEHGRAPDSSVSRWQDRLNPLWGRIGGGCNLNRDIPALIREGGFKIDRLETMYVPKTLRVAGFNYWGTAQSA